MRYGLKRPMAFVVSFFSFGIINEQNMWGKGTFNPLSCMAVTRQSSLVLRWEQYYPIQEIGFLISDHNRYF